MHSPRTARLRKAPDAPIEDSRIIDARFKIVGRRRSIARTLWRGLLAVLGAALIGFLIPPIWVLIETIRDHLGGR